MPKQLLPVAGKPIIEYPIQNIETTKRVKEIIISVNAYFESNFREWFMKYHPRKRMNLVIEQTYSNVEKPGSIGAIHNLIKGLKINEDLLVIGGDNLFSFSLQKFINYFSKKKTSVVALYNISDKSKAAGLYGVAQIDKNEKIIGFEEKPSKPKTSLVNTACYIIKKGDLPLIGQYIQEGKNKDALGYLLEWMIKKTDMHGFVFDSPWFDIGSFEAYNKANKYYREERLDNLKTRKVITKLEK